MDSRQARVLANLIEPSEARALLVRGGEDINRCSRPILRIVACTKCRAVWKGNGALARGRKHAVRTGHVLWSLSGTWELLLPRRWHKKGER